jgi:SAM-dependent methyltransferase
LRQLAREAANLTRGRSGDVSEKVAGTLSGLREIEQLADDRLGLELKGLKMLDIGAGQLMMQMTYFGQRGNEVVGIDQDVIARRLSIRLYADMLRKNGPKRVVKTLGRKALLVDSRYTRELARQLDAQTLPSPRVLQMDAANMTFSDATFDFVYALAVFQHLPDPPAVLDEMIRVLKPGGALYLDFILFTSRGGSHDVRLLGGQNGAIPDWAHLRAQYEALVQPNAYLNRIRLPEWVTLFEGRMPDVHIAFKQPDAERLEAEVRLLWQQGELREYSLDELLTNKVTVLWRKPVEG